MHHHPGLPALPFKFLGSLRASLMLLHPSPNWAESLVHVHFKEETGITELIVLCLPTSGLPLLHVQDTQSQVQTGAGSAHHGHSTRITAHICGALHTLWPDATLNSGEVFPYLVVITGLENVLVLTKSVVSTPVDLKRKLCIAQGLSRESWSIMKTMVTELGIILVGYFTLMPSTQEFLLLCHCGPVSDFFLQTLFFSTVH